MAEAPEDLAELRKDLKRALKIMDERRDDYELGRDFYTGDRVEVAASKYVRKIINENSDAFPISLAHIPVDVIVDHIELTSIEAADRASTKLLDAVTKANDLPDLSEDVTRKAAYFGDYYVIIDPAEEEGDGQIVAESVRWIGSSPLTTIAVYDEVDEREAVYYVKCWLKGKTWHARLYYDDCTVKMVTPKGQIQPDPKSFVLDFDDEEADAFIMHDGGRPLVKHLAIDGHPYGTPLHRKAWGPQDALTKISATNLAGIEGLGLPARWALLDPSAEIDDDIDGDFGDDGPDTVPGSETADGMTTATRGSKVRTVPGGISYLAGVSKVGTFENGDKAGTVFLSNQDWYVRAMAVATGIPLFEFDLTGDQPSGESRRRAMSRALKKAKRVRRAVGGFLVDLAETTLAVLGQSGQKVTAIFYPIETSTDKDGIELVGLKVSNGVPVRTALLEAGYTDDQVDEWWPKDAPAVTYDVLTALATALNQLGQAQTLGVITPEETADMLPTILTGARREGPQPAPIAQPSSGMAA